MKISNILTNITNNLPAKILSLALAILLYLSNQMLSLETKKFAIPITVQETGAMVIKNTLPKAVQVRIKSTPENVTSIDDSDIKIQLDTRQYFDSGKYDISLDLITAPGLVNLDPLEIEITPKTLSVYLEKRVGNWLPLAPVYTGECAHGYKVSEISFEPQTVHVSGAADSLQAISAIKADKITLTDKNRSFTTDAYIQNFSNAVNIEIPNKITANVTIVPVYETQIFSNITVQPVGLNPYLKIEENLPLISIELYGTLLDIESYKSSLIDIQADFSQITKAGEYEVPLRVFISSRFDMKSINPVNIKVIVISADKENIGNTTETNKSNNRNSEEDTSRE
jgi:YbbR domain-containing protein